MKFLRFGEKGQEKAGLLDQDGCIRDLSDIVQDIDGVFLEQTLPSLLKNIDISSLKIVDPNVRIGACLNRVGKFICIGLNYSDHAQEVGIEPPQEPVVFNKWTSAISGPHDNIELPRAATKTDWEVELGVIIGKSGKYISVEDAMTHVAGYCVVNDVSERVFQLERGGSWDKGKGCDSFGPIGPYLVTRDEIADPHQLGLWLEVDGVRYQNGTTANMVFKIPDLIHYLSQFMSLQAGDIIATGTPAGVGAGQNPPTFLQAGQIVRLGIDGLGEQSQVVVAAS